MPINPPLDPAALQSALNSAGNPWIAGPTSMTALTEAERVARLGVPLPAGLDVTQLQQEAVTAAAAAAAASGELIGAPTAFDLRNVNGANYTTPVKQQGQCGSCVAFGTVATLEHVTRYTRGAPNLAMDLSEAHMYYCHGRAVGATCASGWLPEPALDAARDKGVTFENYYPYTAGDQNCTGLNADWPNRRAKAVSWSSLTNNPAGMKQAISQYGSITACFYVYQDFFQLRDQVYRYVSGSLAGGHCVVLVGYDDAQGCWIGKNSWDTTWGNGGFFRIAYGQCGIETWHVCGVPATSVRAWLPDQQITALWSNEADNNIYAYGAQRGWIKLADSGVPAGESMLLSLAADKAGGRQVGIFEDNGVAQQVYAW